MSAWVLFLQEVVNDGNAVIKRRCPFLLKNDNKKTRT